MIDKTKKRSLFVRIAFVLFAVALAFCSVSVVLNEGKYKAEAYNLRNYQDDGNLIRNFYSDPFYTTYYTGYVAFRIFSYQISVSTPLSGEGSPSIFFDSSAPTVSADFYYKSYGINQYSNLIYVWSDLVDLSLYDFDNLLSFEYGRYLVSDLNLPSFVSIDYEYCFYSVYQFSAFSVYMIAPYYDSSIFFSVPSFGSQETITESVTDVWTSIFTWLTTSVNSLLGILYINGELTILGVLVVMSLGISIFFLLLAVVSNFFHLRS